MYSRSFPSGVGGGGGATVQTLRKSLLVNSSMKVIEQYFHVVLFILLYKVVLTFKSVDENLVCGHSNESY